MKKHIFVISYNKTTTLKIKTMLQFNNSSRIMNPTRKSFNYKLLFLLICLQLPVLPMFGQQFRAVAEMEEDYKAAVAAKDYDKILSVSEEYLDSWNARNARALDVPTINLVEGAGWTWRRGENALKFKDKLYFFNKQLVAAFITVSERMADAYMGKNDTIAALKHLTDILGVIDSQRRRADYNTSNYIARHAVTLFYRRAYIYWEQGEFEKAVTDYIFSLGMEQLDRYSMLDKMTLSMIVKDRLVGYYLENNEYYNALHILERWLKVDAANMTASDYAKLCFACWKVDKMEDAIKYYDEATKLDPKVDVAPETLLAIIDYITKQEKQQQELEKQLKEAEARRVAAIKGAQIGDRLLYSEEWNWTETELFIRREGTATMYVICFIERIEGDRYQLRIGDVVSSNSGRYKTPVINGVKVSKGDIIWARPQNDSKWVYGE